MFPVKSLLKPFIATGQVSGVQVSARKPLLHFMKTLNDGGTHFFRLVSLLLPNPGEMGNQFQH